MRCRDCGSRSEPVNGLFSCGECGFSVPVVLFQPVDIGGPRVEPPQPSRTYTHKALWAKREARA